MNILKLTLLSLCLLATPSFGADTPAVLPPAAADPLTEALPLLQAKYVDFKALNYKPGDHLTDLLTRSNGEISLAAPATASLPLPIVTASLPDGVIYWRMATFTPEKSWLDLGTQLEQASANTKGVILDLRSNIAPDDYNGAAQVMGFFAPQDIALSKYEALGLDHGVRISDHPLQVPIVVLTNNQTIGAAEALAAFLKADGALVMGRETRGLGAVFDEQKLSSGQVLRFVVDKVTLADGTPLWGHPVVPDISMTVNDRTEKTALTLIKDNHILDVIQESEERHRLSEATLVQGQDPEWDDYLASLEQKHVLLSLPAIHDTVLIGALDSLKAIRLSQRTLPPQATVNVVLPSPTSIQ